MEDRTTPTIGDNEILVKLSAVGVCGTDLSLAAGHIQPSREILGHEGVGRVVKVGAAVDPLAVKVNDRLGVGWIRDACSTCEYCREPGGETRCVRQYHSGRSVDGCFAEYCVVPARYALRLNESDVTDEAAAPIMCGGVTAYKAIKSSGAREGDWIAVVGAGGGVGAFAIQYAKAMGCKVLALDVGRTKEQYCGDLGADAYQDALDEPIINSANKIGHALVSAVIVVAGSAAAYRTGVDLVGPHGTVVAVGIPPPQQTLMIHPLELIDRGIRLIGSMVGTRQDTLEAMAYVERGLVKPCVEVVSLEELNDVMKWMASVSKFQHSRRRSIADQL